MMTSSALTPETFYDEVIPEVLEDFEEGDEFTAADICSDDYFPTHLGMYLSRWETVCGDGVTSYINTEARRTYVIHDPERAKEGIYLLKDVKEDERPAREMAYTLARTVDVQDSSIKDIANLLAEEGIGTDIPRRLELAREILDHAQQ